MRRLCLMEKEDDIQSDENLKNLSPHVEIPAINVHSNQSEISDSGNSKVDIKINIQVDVKPIAFAIIYTLLAVRQISEEEFQSAIKKIEDF
jgi:hypothetical protein